MLIVARIVILLFVVTLIVIEYWRGLSRQSKRILPSQVVLTGLSVLNIGFIIYLWSNHIGFPLNLDLMEGTILEHFRRALDGLPVYPPPSPDYVPLAYNPLYYYFAVPFSWVLGDGLATLRFVSILGMAVIGVAIFIAVRGITHSGRWACYALGLFAAAYMAMDAYLDSVHSDSWMIAMGMLGTLLVASNKSVARNLLGLLLLVGSFWFKQHGALLALGGLLFLFLKSGWKSSLIYAALVIIVGPLVYLLLGQQLFGTHFHFFTWNVPRQWSEISRWTFVRYFGFIVGCYAPVALPACWSWYVNAKRGVRTMDVWHFQLPFAMLTGFMGALDAGSSNNVFITQGIWFVIIGVVALKDQSDRSIGWIRRNGSTLLLASAFAILLYDPRSVIVSSHANEKYEELVQELKRLPGHVYAPSLGQLDHGYRLSPTAHWVALEDIIRAPGRDLHNHPTTRALLAPLLNSQEPQFILTNTNEFMSFMQFLDDYYVLEKDYGERFRTLGVLPKRWNHGYPRYLYRQRTTPLIVP
jgi:hypothetical protein